MGLGPILGLALEAGFGTDLHGDGLGPVSGLVWGLYVRGVLGPVLEPVLGQPWHGYGDRSGTGPGMGY